MRENLLEASRRAIDLGRDPTFDELYDDFIESFPLHELLRDFVRTCDEAADPPRIKQFRKIVKTKSFGKVDGTPVDLFSASAVTQVYDALSKPANQRKYAKMDPVEMISIAYKLLQKGRKAASSRETSEGQADWRGKPFLPALRQAAKAYDATVKVQGKRATIKMPSRELAADLVRDLGKDNPEYFWKTKKAVVKGDTVTVVLPAGGDETSREQTEQGDPPSIKQFRKIVKTKSMGKVGGVTVDLFSASAVVNVYDKLTKPAVKKKFANLDTRGMVKVAFKALKDSKETSQASAGVLNALAQAIMGKGEPLRPQGNAQVARSQEGEVREDIRLSKGDQKVIRAFADKKAATSKKLDTDGTTLDGLWMGGGGIAHWKGNKIHLGPIGGRSGQTVQKALRRYAAKNDFAEFAGAIVRHVARGAAVGVAKKSMGKEARKKISPKQIAQGALKAFTKKHGEFNRNNKRHINTIADVLRDEYLAAVRKGLDYPDYKSIEAELYKLTKGPSRFSMGTEAAGKLKMFRKASGSQPDVYQVLNPSGGVEGFIEKQPDTKSEKYPWKAFGRTYGGKPARGKHLGDFPNKNAAMKAVMKAG